MEIQNKTKFEIAKPAAEVYEAFVNPSKLCNFWFSDSSCRWETGKTATLSFVEYGASGFDIRIIDAKPGEKIEFLWGEGKSENTVIINLTNTDASHTNVEVIETGWHKDDPELTEKLIGNKEGWVYMLCCLKAYLENGITTLRTGMIHE